jgi:hypothetical protein
LKDSPLRQSKSKPFNTNLGSYIEVIEQGLKDLNENNSTTYHRFSKIGTLDASNRNDKVITLTKNGSKKSNSSLMFFNSLLNNTTKINLDKSKSEYNNLNEIHKYFQENDMNFFNFCEFFQNLRNSENENKFLFVLVISNKNIVINRDPISNYEIIVVIFSLSRNKPRISLFWKINLVGFKIFSMTQK